jgi:septation ring formation regulator EzrA
MAERHEETKDLYILVGNYESFSQTVFKELKEINQRLEAGDKNFQTFEQRCAAHGTQLTDHEKRIKTVEKIGVPKRTKLQLDGTTLLTFVNTILTVLSRLWPF